MDILGVANSSYVCNPLYRFDCDAGSTSFSEANIYAENHEESLDSPSTSSEDSVGATYNDKWNERWIEIKSLLNEQKYKDFSHLAQDFENYFFQTLRKLFYQTQMPVELQEAKSMNFVALDYFGLYGSDEKSMKVAGHELRGMMSLLSCGMQEINVPLMSIIDYRGFRIVALSLLPIGTDTIVYGTADAGQTIHNKDAYFSSLMNEVASFLKLKVHSVNGVEIALCADCEGHLGKDKRYYMLDFARIMPPEFPKNNTKSIFYELLRPELVQSNPVPLNSDAFTGFLANYNSKREDNQDVIDATKRLHEVVIPLVAETLDNKPSKNNISIKNELRESGVNMRHLGRVRSKCKNEVIRSLLLSEMVARVFKEELKVELRKAMKKSNDYVWYFNKTIEFLNNIFSIEKEIYWSKKCHLKRLIIDKFGSESLSALEMDDSYALYENLDLRNLIKYFQVITGVVLREVGTSILALGDCLILSDLVDISTRIKSMNLVSEAKGMELTQLATHTSGSEVFRLLELAHSHFEESTTRFPSSWTTYKNWGISLKTFALHEAIVSPVTKYLILFMSLGKLTRAYEVRMRSFKEEDVFLNYEIIFVCIQLILNEKMLRIKLPSFKIADYLLEAKKYSPFFSKLSCDHAIYHTLSEDISKYGLFFASCFINIYLPHDPYLVKLKNLQFLSQSPSEDSHENIIRRSTSKTSEGFDMFSLTLSQSLVPIDLYNIKSLYIPICPYLSITHDLIHVIQLYPNLTSFRFQISENQYPKVVELLQAFESTRVEEITLIFLPSLPHNSKIKWPVSLTKLHIMCSTISDECAATLLANAPSLTDISFNGCNLLTNETTKLFSKLPKLSHLSLGEYKDDFYKNEYRMSVSLTEKIEIVAKGLTYLSLEGLITLPPSELESIVRNCPNLTKLYTPRKSQKQDGYSISIFMDLKKLKTLRTDMRTSKSVRDEEIKSLKQFAKSVPLEYLQIYSSIAPFFVALIIQHFTSLIELRVSEAIASPAEQQQQQQQQLKSKKKETSEVSCWAEFQEWWDSHNQLVKGDLSAQLQPQAQHHSKSHRPKFPFMKGKPEKEANDTSVNNSNNLNPNNNNSSDTNTEARSNFLPTVLVTKRVFLYQSIRLIDCNIDNSQFTILVENSPFLKEVQIRKCFILTPESLSLLSKLDLRAIQFINVPFATDECVANIIETISLRNPKSIEKFKYTIQNIVPKLICKSIALYCKNLFSLIFSETKITEEVLQNLLLATQMTSLRYLEVNSCLNISKEFINKNLRYKTNGLRIVGGWIPTECTSVTSRLV